LKTLFKPEEFENNDYVLSSLNRENILKTELLAFLKKMALRQSCDLSARDYLNHKSKTKARQ